MNSYPTAFKQHILTLYQPHCRGNGFTSLAKRFGIKGGEPTIKYWYDRWDGTPESLEPKPRSGRPNIFNSEEIKQYIGTPIKRKNRRSEAVHYTELIDTLREKTGKRVSLRTVQ
jgi:transposase